MSNRSFAKAHAGVIPQEGSNVIVVSGLYRFSRNPMYVFMAFLYLGIASLINDPWFITILVPVLLVVRYGVIGPEEVYLTKKFGKTYTDYKESVRRWI